MLSRNYFQGKRIAVIGLGSNGEMLADIEFLVKAGTLLSVYDLSSETRVKNHLAFLSSVGLATYVCGSIPIEDLPDMDMIILSREYPRDSSFLKEVRQKKIPIEYPETLFFKLAPPVTIVGISGSCGKSTVMSMLAPILKSACLSQKSQSSFVINTESGNSVLSNLKKIKSNDLLLIRIDAYLAHDLHELRISPHVGIFTTIPEKNIYAESPFEILEYQTYNNFIVAPDYVIDYIHTFKFQPKAKMLRTKSNLIPKDWLFHGRGLHDRDNAALTLQVARLFKVPDETSGYFLGKWKPIEGRLELVKKIKNIEFYNDATSISPHATIAGLMALGTARNIILIFGGADNAGDFQELYSILPNYAHTLITIPGSGTLRQRKILCTLDKLQVCSAPSLEEAVRLAYENAKKGDRVLFSPGFNTGGIDRSRRERGERFVKAVRGL